MDIMGCSVSLTSSPAEPSFVLALVVKSCSLYGVNQPKIDMIVCIMPARNYDADGNALVLTLQAAWATKVATRTWTIGGYSVARPRDVDTKFDPDGRNTTLICKTKEDESPG